MTNRLAAWGPAAVWAAVLFFLSAQPGADWPPLLFAGEDKVVHAGLYAVLGAALVWGSRKAAPTLSDWALVLLGSLYGVSDEWHQSFVSGRDPSLGDWTADTVGVLLGYWITSVVLRNTARAPGARRPHETTPGLQPE